MKNLIYFTTLIVLIFTLGCADTNEISLEKDITIDEVQDFVNQTKQSRGRLNTTSIIWDFAAYRDISIGDALLFPVENSDMYISAENGSERLPLSTSQFAFAYKVDDEVKVELVQPVPTADTELFTGYYLISDWEGNVKRFLEFEDGFFSKERKIIDDHSTSGRSNSSSCFVVTYWECTQTSVGGDVISTHCDNAGSSLVCVEDEGIVDDEPVNPDDYGNVGGGGSTGGGGGSGGNPSGGNNGGNPSGGGNPVDDEEYCPHPFVPELMVVCEAPLCGEGQVLDEDGMCVFLSTFNDFVNPCLKEIGDHLKNNAFHNDINRIIKTVFGDNEFKTNLQMREDINSNTLAHTRVKSDNFPYEVEIIFNPNLINGASKEYLAAVLYHEALHAYIFHKSGDPELPQIAQHSEIAQNYVEWISQALIELYPASLSVLEANGLALRGLNDFNQVYPDVFNQIVTNSGFSSYAELITVTDLLRNGENGTKCIN